MKIKTIRIDALKLDEANVIDHQAADVRATARSLLLFGQQKPIVVSSDYWVAAGNGTVLAATTLGWTEVQAHVSDLDAAQLRAYSIADNKTGRKAEWHDENLVERLQEIAAEDMVLLEGTAFELEELAELLDDFEEPLDWGADLPMQSPAPDVPDVEPQTDRAEELREQWGTEAGQLWGIPGQAGEHRLLCGDSTCAEDVERLIGGENAELLLSDPPYGIGWNADYSRFRRGSSDKRPIAGDDYPFDPRPFLSCPETILWGANHYAASLTPASWLVWDKRNADGTAFLSDAEVAWWSVGKGVYLKTISAQQHRASGGGHHPTQKPVELFCWCIEKAKSDGLIFDPFLGSGTTMLAAEQLGRVCYGMEISPAYCAVILQRMTDAGLEPRRLEA